MQDIFMEIEQNNRAAIPTINEDKTGKLVWNVIYEDWNGREIKVFNIFEHFNFYNDLIKYKKDANINVFAEHVRSELLYYFWSKAEWEVVVTTWPPYLNKEQIEKIQAEVDQRKSKDLPIYRIDTGLDIGKKIDVYDQIMINFEPFIQYLWKNRKLLKKKS